MLAVSCLWVCWGCGRVGVVAVLGLVAHTSASVGFGLPLLVCPAVCCLYTYRTQLTHKQELAKALNTNVNSLPLSLDISWFEQKAVAVLLTLLNLGVQNIRLGPNLPGTMMRE